MRAILPAIAIVFLSACYAEAAEIRTQIRFKTSLWADTVGYLASFRGNSLKVIDTLRIDEKGKCRRKASYPIGEYAIVLPDRSQIRLIINEKKLTITQDSETTDFGRSLENNLYQDFLDIERQLEKKRIQLQSNNSGDLKIISEKVDQLEITRTLFLSLNAENVEKTFAGKIIKAISGPNDLVYYSQHPSSAKWVKKDFLRGIDFADETMYYTEIFHLRTKFYMERVLEQNADTIINNLVELLEKSKPAQENFQFLFSYYMSSYSRSKYPQHELVFKYLFENYCATGQTPWIEEAQQMRWEAEIGSFQNLLIGTTPVQIELYDTAGNPLRYNFSHHQYTLLIFWSPGCAHCRAEVPQYYKVYQKHKDKGFETIAVYTEIFEDEWKEFIKEENLSWHNGADTEQKGNLKRDFFISETSAVILVDSSGIIVDKRFTAGVLNQFLKANLD